METLKRIIQNEKEAMERNPVINQNVERIVMIKEIEPKTLIDYAMEIGLSTPKVMTDKLETWYHFNDHCSIFLSSSKVQTTTTWKV